MSYTDEQILEKHFVYPGHITGEDDKHLPLKYYFAPQGYRGFPFSSGYDSEEDAMAGLREYAERFELKAL